jgi:hypothetical protein
LFPVVRLALGRASRREPARFRIVHFSVQRDHVHLIVEARDKRALSGGVRSAAIRVALYVNQVLRRRGPLWAERWHGRALKTPREVRNALVYVLANFRKHARRTPTRGIDPYSSGAWFDGWRGWQPRSGAPPPFAERRRWREAFDETNTQGRHEFTFAAQTWLAVTGWRHHGLIDLWESPATS